MGVNIFVITNKNFPVSAEPEASNNDSRHALTALLGASADSRLHAPAPLAPLRVGSASRVAGHWRFELQC
eukprot:5515931-Pleurochrysis_carterae.AAC.2